MSTTVEKYRWWGEREVLLAQVFCIGNVAVTGTAAVADTAFPV